MIPWSLPHEQSSTARVQCSDRPCPLRRCHVMCGAQTESRFSLDLGVGIDVGVNGNVNSGAIGVLQGQAVAILPNPYGAVYGTGIDLRVGTGYWLNDASELRAVLTFQSADADLVRLGDLGPSSSLRAVFRLSERRARLRLSPLRDDAETRSERLRRRHARYRFHRQPQRPAGGAAGEPRRSTTPTSTTRPQRSRGGSMPACCSGSTSGST